MSSFLAIAWLIPLFPLLGFLIITLVPMIRQSKAASGWLAIALMAAATAVAIGVGLDVANGVHIDEQGHRTVVPAGEHGETANPEHGAAPAEGQGGEATAGEHAGEAFTFPTPNIVSTFRWAPVGNMAFTMGYYIDPAVAAMLVMVTIASTCIHLFSMGYMAHDERQSRFFSFISLFTCAMLLMIMSSNLLLFFMAWEMMGLCSYLLIGFWYYKVYTDPNQITPRQAAIKAFTTTRVGDVLFMVGLAYLWTQAGTLDFGSAGSETTGYQIFNADFLHKIAAETNMLGMSVATAIALLLFAGTVGKSAQVPLHVWLPDAMEGPTPVSALIHAATMVAAGVFLVGRTYPIFQASGTALSVVAIIGTITAVFAALIAVGQYDIKRILAYSTLSQLGFMVAALGIGGWVAGMFHLLTHAFFKALLFLGSGSVIHGMEATVGHDSNTAQDIRNMGNLRKYMPWTFWTYLAGYLALAGFPGLAGFWSKDEILADAFGHGYVVIGGLLIFASFLTAFYMTRQVVLVFTGNFRGHNPRRDTHPSEPKAVTHAHSAGHPEKDHHGHGHDDQGHGQGGHDPHESPWVMLLPLFVLAVFAVLGGFANLPGSHWLATFFGQEAGELNVSVMGAAILMGLLGIFLGWSVYKNAFKTAQDVDPLERMAPGLFRALNRKFYFDELYANLFGKLSYGLALTWSWFDRNVLDRIINGTGIFTMLWGQLNFIIDDFVLNDGADQLADGAVEGGNSLRHAVTGKIQDYVSLIFGGVVIIAGIYLYLLTK